MKPKTQSNFRLTDDAKALITALAEKLGLSQAAVIETAVRQMAKREKVRVTVEEHKS